MPDMTISEFVSKVVNDKAFLLEVCKNIPDDMVQEENQQTEGIGLARAMSRYYYAAVQAMGYGFDEGDFEAECIRQIGGMKGFSKAKYVMRFFSTLSKTGKGKKN